MIYLDNAASAPLRASAREAMEAAWEVAGNPSAVHAAGRAARSLLEDARESLAADIGAHPGEIVFCSGGTEANNLALRGLGGVGIAVSAVEHPSILNAQGRLAQVEVLRVDTAGRVVLPAGLDGPTTDPSESGAQLLSVQLVNGETGVVQPLAEVVEFARRQRALVHSDAVQALGHLRLDFAGVGVDAMTLSAHKIGGPVGIGALVVRRSLDFRPYGFGGEQESKRRPGTVPAALAAGFAAAVRQATAELAAESERLRRLHDRLISHSRQAIPDVAANCSGECSPAIVNLTFAGLRADDLLLLLDRAQISCSVGSACTAGVHRPSPVLLAMGRTVAQASASLRFSFGWQTSEADIDALVDALMPAVDQARTARTAP